MGALLLQPGSCCGCGTTICVYACGMLVVGAVVDIYSGSTLITSCTTGSGGCCSVSVSGSYTVEVYISGNLAYDAVRSLSGTVNIYTSSSAVVCCGSYAIPSSLTLTDAAGSLSFEYNPNYTYPMWTGGHSVQRTSCTVTATSSVCNVAAPTTGPVRICYQMVCYSGQNPAFAFQRSWSWVYQPVTLTPIWYQDPSGFTPGAFCITAPPAICGNPLTDSSSFNANPTSNSPFALSGTPVPAGSNATTDPVGGSVAISA